MLETVIVEWLSVIVRWLHVVAGIAWIGSSFYFIHLDLSLKPRPGLPEGVKGDAWQVHGGGFYHMIKYLVAPAQMPDDLTWFKWEAYATWLSGMGMLVIVYYLGAELFLIDKNILDLGQTSAIVLSLGTLFLGWAAYEVGCRSPLGKNAAALSLVGYVFLVAVTWGLTHLFSGRGAFVQIGALVGTIMVANVFVIIIPYQKKTVAALIAGETPDPYWGAIGKQRSVHNNYLTLPVVFLMISTHYPLLYATRWNWVIVAIVLATGPVIRHFFNMRHEGKGSPWWTWVVAAAAMIAVAWLSAAGPRDTGMKTGANEQTNTSAAVAAAERGSAPPAADSKQASNAPAANSTCSPPPCGEGSGVGVLQNSNHKPASNATAAPTNNNNTRSPTFAAVEDIIISRCSMCHASEPVWAGIGVAPRGVMLDTPERIRAHARQIAIFAAYSDAMPPGNVTELSAADRRVLREWEEQKTKLLDAHKHHGNDNSTN